MTLQRRREHRGRINDVHIGIVAHFGWAVAVTASRDHRVADRRRLDLIESGLPAAPVHHLGGPHLLHRAVPLDDDALAALVDEVRASVVRSASGALGQLAASLPAPVVSMSVRGWPDDFPEDIATQRRVPYESRADSVMYRRVLADVGQAHGWQIRRFDEKHVEDEAAHLLGDRAWEVLYGPRSTLGPPWTKDHRTALAAAITAM